MKIDWLKEEAFVNASVAHQNGDLFLWEVANVAASIALSRVEEELQGCYTDDRFTNDVVDHALAAIRQLKEGGEG